MKAGAGKSKGSAFEREICKRLSLWVSNGKNADLFWRSAMSGGRATVRGKKVAGELAHVSGDICAVHPAGFVLTDNLFIECKHYKDLNYQGYILNGTGPIAVFWKKTVEQAISNGKIPFLILKQNQVKTMVMVHDYNESFFSRQMGSVWIPKQGVVLIELDILLAASFPFRKRITL